MARPGTRRGAVVAPLVQVLCLAQLALLVIEQDDWDTGARLVDRARLQVERFGLVPYPSVALVPAICALVEAHRGRVEDARRDLRRSTRLLDAVVDFPAWYEAEIRILLAQTAMRLDDPNSARQRLTEAAAVLELIPDAPMLDAWLRRATSSLDAFTAAANGDSGLTPAELRTLQYLPTHYSFREIGEQLRYLREYRAEPGASRLSQARRQHSTRGGGARAEPRSDRDPPGVPTPDSPSPRAGKGVRNGRHGPNAFARRPANGRSRGQQRSHGGTGRCRPDYDDSDFDSYRAEGETPDSEEGRRSEQDKWRRWAWAALVVLVVGVAWALTLSTILLNRSGDNTAELISLFEQSQERRQAALEQSSQSEEARRAALDTTIAESRTFRGAGPGRSCESSRAQCLSTQSPGAGRSRRRAHQSGEHRGGACPGPRRQGEPRGALPKRRAEKPRPVP